MKNILFLLALFFISPNICKPMKETEKKQSVPACLQGIQKKLTKWEFHQLNELCKNKPSMAEPIILKATSNSAQENVIDKQSGDFFGRTPLHIAIARGEFSKIGPLLKNGTYANAKTLLGQNALHYIALSRKMPLPSKLAALDLLAKHQELEINEQDIFGATPLLYATQLKHEKIFYRLAALGADIYMPGNNGNTPLHWAARAHNLLICVFLINKACNDNYNYRIYQNIDGAVAYNWLFNRSDNPPDSLVNLLNPNNYPLTPIITPQAFRPSKNNEEIY